MSRAESLFQILLAGQDSDEPGEAVNDFLSKLYDGYEIDSVQTLLESSNIDAVGHGIFLFDELGRRAAPLREVALKLACRSDYYQRYVFLTFCINTQLVDNEIIVAIGRLLEDPDLRVRVRAMLWIANAKPHALDLLWRALHPDEAFSFEDVVGEWPKERYFHRGQRVFRIGVGIKLGQDIVDIQERMHHEDSYTFEMLRRLYVVIEPAESGRAPVDSKAYWERQRVRSGDALRD